MPQFLYELKIPKSRVAVLIGKNGESKNRICQETKTRIDVDSKEGDVFLEGDDAVLLYTAREIIKAIGRGFNPDIALLLLKQDNSLETISITDYAKNQNSAQRLKGRIIGAEGKSRHMIEELTDTYISVFGKTVCIIGRSDNVVACRSALEMLLQGSPHGKVYHMLERRRSQMKRGGMDVDGEN